MAGGQQGQRRSRRDRRACPIRRTALRIVDRAADFMVTSGGKTLTPSISRTSFVPARTWPKQWCRHARQVHHRAHRNDYDTVADWARNRNIGYTGFTNLTQHPDIEQLLQTEIDRANRMLARVESGQDLPHLPKALESRGGRRTGHAEAQGSSAS